MKTIHESAVLAGMVRTPFTLAQKGALAGVRPDDMLAAVLKAAKERFLPEDVYPEDVMAGCAFPEGEQGLNVARMAVFLAGFPDRVAAVTLNRFCGSAMSAVHMAAGAIACGAGDVFLAAGVESMSRIPMGGFAPMPHPGLYSSNPDAYESMGITAENLARQYNISREEQEAFALESHRKATEASATTAAEIVAVEGVSADGCIRPGTSLSDMAKLKPAFLANGSVTAATSAPLTDGAACVVVCAESFAMERGIRPLARIRSMAVAGCAPGLMGIGPVPAARIALARAGLAPEDMDIIELNEAFAAQSLAVLRELPFPMEKVNVEGGALALGHPLGASGARIVGKAARLLQERDKQFALAMMCVGGGQGTAVVLEAV